MREKIVRLDQYVLKDCNPALPGLANIRVMLIDRCQRFSPETSFESSSVTPRHARFSNLSGNKSAPDMAANNEVTNRGNRQCSFSFGETRLELCRFSETGNRGNQMLDDQQP